MASIVRNFMAGLSPREKKMVAAMAATAVVLSTSLTAFLVTSAISDLEMKNAEWSQLISYIQIREDDYRARMAAQTDMEKVGKPKPLRTLVDSVVQKLGVTDPDTKELGDQDHASGWTEHGVEVSFREIDLGGLVHFMEEVEGYRTQFPIAITKLEVRSRRREENSFTVKMTISTYEREQTTASDATTRKKSRARGGR